MAKARLNLVGDRKLQQTLKALSEKAARRVLRASVSAGATPILKAAKQNVPEESGLLKKSLGRKSVTKRNRDVAAIIGPRTNVEGEFNGEKRVPHRYAHLVEEGHVAPDGSFVEPQPFLRPALVEQSGAAFSKMKDTAARRIEAEAKKAQGGR